MSTGFPGAYQSRLSPCRKILVTPRLQGVLQYKKSTEKHATQQRVKPKSKKAKFAPHFHKDLHVQLEQVWCFRCISVWELLGRKNIKASGAALCKYKLVAESFYLSLLSKTWVDRIQMRNTPSTYGGSSQGDQHRQTHEGEGLAKLEGQPGSIQGRGS